MLGVDPAGEANGRRVLSKFNAQMVARDVLNKWKGLSGEKLDKYMADNFDKLWA